MSLWQVVLFIDLVIYFGPGGAVYRPVQVTPSSHTCSAFSAVWLS